MSRLWVRIALMVTGVLCLVFLWQFGVIRLGIGEGPAPSTAGESGDRPPYEGEITFAELRSRLYRWLALSLVVGVGAGAVIGAVVTRPIGTLARAARAVGSGDLSTRVAVRGSSEIRALAESFNRMAADLARAEQVRRSLLADVSHELRTPLSVLEGTLRAALDEVMVMDGSAVASLYQQAHHLTRLVNDLRELSVADAHQLSLSLEDVDLAALALDVTQSVEPLAAEKDIALSCRPEGRAVVRGDDARLRQVLLNLLSNALRHTPGGGRIDVGVREDGDAACLWVSDTGDGMAPELVPLVFDRFFRAEPSRSREAGGTGLGLAIVKSLVETLGGSVGAESGGPGRGSRFEVKLPLMRKEKTQT